MDTTLGIAALIAINLVLLVRAELVDRRAQSAQETLLKLAAAERAAATAERAQLAAEYARERQILLNRIQAPETAIVQTLEDPFNGQPVPKDSEQDEIDGALDEDDDDDFPEFELAGGVVNELALELAEKREVGVG